MLRLNISLILILVICALSVVTAQHKARKLFVMLENEKEIARQLEVEWGKLQLEQSTLAMHGRIETIVSGQLNMKVPSASRIQIISPGATVDWANFDENFKP